MDNIEFLEYLLHIIQTKVHFLSEMREYSERWNDEWLLASRIEVELKRQIDTLDNEIRVG